MKMRGRLIQNDVEKALQNLNDQTLRHFASDFAKLIYLASTRDYNTGRYYHDGLALRFSEPVSEAALEQAHHDVFFELAFAALQDLTRQLQSYFESLGAEPLDIIRSWTKLEPYRVTIPVKVDTLTAEFFFLNVKTALAIVQPRLKAVP